VGDARAVAAALVEHFADADGTGFFTTGDDAEALIVRPKDVMDNAVPAENSLAGEGLLRLAAFTGEAELARPAFEHLAHLAETMAEHPSAFGFLLVAYERATTPAIEVAIVGDEAAATPLRREVFGRLLPASVVATRADGEAPGLTPLLAGRPAAPGSATAYVCEDYACRQPTTRPEELRAQLDAALAARAGSG
jgi:hypothetical protein